MLKHSQIVVGEEAPIQVAERLQSDTAARGIVHQGRQGVLPVTKSRRQISSSTRITPQ